MGNQRANPARDVEGRSVHGDSDGAEDLVADMNRIQGGPRGRESGGARALEASVRISVLEGAGGGAGQEAGRLQPHMGVGQGVGDGLELPDGAAELLSGPGVFGGLGDEPTARGGQIGGPGDFGEGQAPRGVGQRSPLKRTTVKPASVKNRVT